ncbi:MAG: 50S ribosomal protein L25 [Candidatus Zambryskibacteria bacterium CG22_combo_CG10-13_8_21_14_all_42_17]|uniref:Large ribosomal subunit protein bL25 n=1 Tax=Candidatus Zambryskibacteria bacterium CG22_combo_CG10-13_8_21_14_all_42_17 TaxID=1975118 RepID=A0A2H0BFX1_9BACT|nr:MAG: 50S ribosomal protein L25 [Candidatus Zambryskibacteria bacterium CG22_combo_CG10-13_8_21_14_all_42_17]
MLSIKISKRNLKDKTEELRVSGLLPAVFYGEKTKSTPISLSIHDFKKIWKDAGESTVVSLIDGSEKHDVLINEVQIHPVTDEPIHADFYALEKGQKVEVEIELEYVGESPAVKNLGGILVKVLHEIEVEAEAANLPQSIEVDISSLVDFEARITVADLKLPAGVVALADPEEVVAIVNEAKEEEESAEEVDISSIEVEKKGKTETEGEDNEDSKS